MKVLNKGFVGLVDHMGSDLSVVNAARVSYGKRSTEFSAADDKLIRYLWRNKHTSPFRHASLQFHIKAPIFVLRQWMKHQVGCSWNEISGRYVEFLPEFYVPEEFRKQSKLNKQGSTGTIEEKDKAALIYETSLNYAFRDYARLLELGVCREQARMTLPTALYSECYWTTSLQAVLHFIKLRSDSHSQWEIQQYANAIKGIVEPLFPTTFDAITNSIPMDI
jgi:thymidylate synthase (FAD)